MMEIYHTDEQFFKEIDQTSDATARRCRTYRCT